MGEQAIMMTAVPILGAAIPDVRLRATTGENLCLAALRGTTVVYAYPRTSPPNAAPIAGWDQIEGARGCTPQSCGFRDHFDALKDAGVDHVFGMSTQDTAYQSEVVARLNLPFAMLSDQDFQFSDALGLATFDAGGMTLLTRTTLIIRDGILVAHMTDVPHPDQNASDVVDLLRADQITTQQ